MSYVTATDLRAALSPSTYLAIFDDDNDGTANADVVALVLQRAHAEVISHLPRAFRGAPGDIPADLRPLLQSAELDFAMAFSFERHPEYVRSFGEGQRLSFYKRGRDTMERVATGAQWPTSDTTTLAPRTVGGIVYDHGPRVLTDSPDGTSNGGDF